MVSRFNGFRGVGFCVCGFQSLEHRVASKPQVNMNTGNAFVRGSTEAQATQAHTDTHRQAGRQTDREQDRESERDRER